LPWVLTIAGVLDRDPAAVARVRASISGLGLAGRVVLAGTADRVALEGLYAAADIFVIASHYEGYGMAAAEAMARGLPMVTSTGGALAATVPDAAGLKFAPGDGVGLRDGLRRMLVDRVVRAGCAEGSWAAGMRLPRWEDTAARVAGVLGRVGRGSVLC
jgi:glycosyltransferase involved in cell wall biosynthesis